MINNNVRKLVLTILEKRNKYIAGEDAENGYTF